MKSNKSKNNLLSAVILSGTETAEMLDKCKRQLDFCNEVVTVNTKSIKGSFSEWRNSGMQNSKGKWVLYVDSDEEVNQELADEIVKITELPASYSVYAVPRKNIIFGKEFKHGDQWPDYQKRLFKKSDFIKWEGELHEEARYNGKLGYLKNPIVHHKDISISQMIDKTNAWSEIEAKLLYDSGHPTMNLLRFASAGFREFYLRFIRQRSFLDGREGVIYGIYQIYSRLITYSKLWEIQLKSK